MDSDKRPNTKLLLTELLEHARAITFAHRHAKIFDCILWEWRQKQNLSGSDDPEAIVIDQAISVINDSLDALLKESDPLVRETFITLLELLQKETD